MSTGTPLELRTLAFGDLDAGLWGFLVSAAGSPTAVGRLGSIGAAPGSEDQELRLDATGVEEPWRLAGEEVELIASPLTAAAPLRAAKDALGGAAQLCAVRGRLRVAGAECELDCLGQRGTRSLPAGLAELESLRDVTAWFAPGDGLALVSLRPQRGAGHDADAVACVVFEDGSPLPIDEPRLSSTYGRDGSPARASVELWLEWLDEPDGEESEQAAAAHFPRRAAGASIGAGVRVSLGPADVEAELFRWHTRGLDGLGVYALTRPS